MPMLFFLICQFMKFSYETNHLSLKNDKVIKNGCILNKNLKFNFNTEENETKGYINIFNDTIKKSWKEYILIDEVTFENDVSEMFYKYKCNFLGNKIPTIENIDDLYVNENMKPILNIYDLNDIFTIEKQDDKKSKKTLEDIKNYILSFDFHLSNKNIFYLNNSNYKEKIHFSFKTKELVDIYNIVLDDLSTILENVLKYNCSQKNFIKDMHLQLQNLNCLDDKIHLLINLSQHLNNSKMQFIQPLCTDRYNFINLTLTGCKRKISLKGRIENKLLRKLKLFQKLINNQYLTEYELLNYFILSVTRLNSSKMREICVLGLKNVFTNYNKWSEPTLFSIVVFLYIYNYENNFYILEWEKKLVHLLSVSVEFKIPIISKKIFQQIFANSNNAIYKLYIALNSKSIVNSLRYYDNLQKCSDKLQFINYLIDIVNLIKCKIFGIF